MQHLRLKAKTGSLCQFLPPIPPLLNVASVRILAAIMFKGRVKHYYDEDDRSSIWVVWAMCWAARHLLEPARPQGALPGWEVSKGLHATCVYSPTSLPCQPPEEQDIFFSLTLIGVFVWKESTYQAWRRLRSRWSSTIIHRVLKLQNIVNSELLASIKLCKLTVCLSIFQNCGTPPKIAKFISYIFFEKPCTLFNI